MLGQEMDARYWARLTMDPVRYADRPIEDIFPELVDASADTLRQFLDGVKSPEMAVPQFLAGTTLLKGAGYKSEREVRIVAIPGTAEIAKYAAKEYPNQFDAIRTASGDQGSARYGQALHRPVRAAWACGCRSSASSSAPASGRKNAQSWHGRSSAMFRSRSRAVRKRRARRSLARSFRSRRNACHYIHCNLMPFTENTLYG